MFFWLWFRDVLCFPWVCATLLIVSSFARMGCLGNSSTGDALYCPPEEVRFLWRLWQAGGGAVVLIEQTSSRRPRREQKKYCRACRSLRMYDTKSCTGKFTFFFSSVYIQQQRAAVMRSLGGGVGVLTLWGVLLFFVVCGSWATPVSRKGTS